MLTWVQIQLVACKQGFNVLADIKSPELPQLVEALLDFSFFFFFLYRVSVLWKAQSAVYLHLKLLKWLYLDTDGLEKLLWVWFVSTPTAQLLGLGDVELEGASLKCPDQIVNCRMLFRWSLGASQLGHWGHAVHILLKVSFPRCCRRCFWGKREGGEIQHCGGPVFQINFLKTIYRLVLQPVLFKSIFARVLRYSLFDPPCCETTSLVLTVTKYYLFLSVRLQWNNLDL